jgi:hypothetical protein
VTAVFHFHHVEGVKLHFVIVVPGVQSVEIGDTVGAEDHGLAVDHAFGGFSTGFGDPWIARAPAATVAREQAHAALSEDRSLLRNLLEPGTSALFPILATFVWRQDWLDITDQDRGFRGRRRLRDQERSRLHKGRGARHEATPVHRYPDC